jgi:ABC-type methionine transport system permease subunit
MTFITGFLALITGLIVLIWRAINARNKKQQQLKNDKWNQQLDELMNAYKKFKK